MIKSAAIALLVLAQVALGVSIESFKVTSVPASGPPKTTEIKHPAAISISANNTKKLTFSLETKPAVVIQPVLLLKSADVSASFVFVPKKGKYSLELELASNSFLQAVRGNPGSYDASLVLGTSTSDKLRYDFGKIRFFFAPTKVGHYANDDPEFSIQPEIDHVFKPDQKMPPILFPMVFSAALLAPWPVLLISWFSLGFNLSKLGSPAMFVYGVSFMGCLGAWVFLFWLYFTVFNLFQLLAYGSILGVVTIFVGRQALVAHSNLK